MGDDQRQEAGVDSRQPQLRVHPFAAMFPMMSVDDLQSLAESIKTIGLVHPIVLDRDGVLIDGRNRRAACEIADVEPRSELLPDNVDPVDFILGVNTENRALKDGQKALFRAKGYLEKWEKTHGEAFDWKAYDEQGRFGSDTVMKFSSPQRELAEHMDVDQSQFSRAKTILHYAPEEVVGVLAGSQRFHTALSNAQRTKKRLEAAAREAEKLHEAVEAVQERLNTLRGADPGLYEFVQDDKLALSEAEKLVEKQHTTQDSAQDASNVEAERTRRVVDSVSNGVRYASGDETVDEDEQAQYLERVIDLKQRVLTVEDVGRSARILQRWYDSLVRQGKKGFSEDEDEGQRGHGGNLRHLRDVTPRAPRRARGARQRSV